MRTRARKHSVYAGLSAILGVSAFFGAVAQPVYEKSGRHVAADFEVCHALWALTIQKAWAGHVEPTLAAGPDAIAWDGATWELEAAPAFISRDGKRFDNPASLKDPEGTLTEFEACALETLKAGEDIYLARESPLLLAAGRVMDAEGSFLGLLAYRLRELPDD